MDLPSDPVPSVHASCSVYNGIWDTTEDEDLWEDDFKHVSRKSCIKRITDSGERVLVRGPTTPGYYEFTGPDGGTTLILEVIPMSGPEVVSVGEFSWRRKRAGGKKETSTLSEASVDNNHLPNIAKHQSLTHS